MDVQTSRTMAIQGLGSDKRKLSLLGIIVILVIVSWSGLLDKVSFNYLDDTFISAVSSYAAARGLNMAISVAESFTVSAGIASVSLGEALDPLNDLVERFSELITLAIGSIVVQKILLTIVSSLFFKVSLTVSAILLSVSMYIKDSPFLKILSQLFIFLVFLRLSLSLMMLLNYTVDQSFLNEQIEHNKEQVQLFSDELDDISSGRKEADETKVKIKEEIVALQKQVPILDNKLTALTAESAKLKKNVGSLASELTGKEEEYSAIDLYNPFREDGELAEMKSDLSQAEKLLDEKNNQIEIIQDQIEEVNSKVIYKQNVIEGKSNGLMGDVGGKVSALTSLLPDVDVGDFIDRAQSYIGNILDLMILYTMKTIILPILFMYMLTKAFRLIWEIELVTFIKREYKSISST